MVNTQKVAILDAKQGNRDVNNSITVAYRNCLALKNYFNADLLTSAIECQRAKKQYDVIFCGFGSTSTEKEASTNFLNRNPQARLFWLVGEYEQSTFAPLFYCGRKFDVLKNFEHPMKNSKIDKQHFVNLNALLMQDSPDIEKSIAQKKYNAIYYGRWREDRGVYFKKYLQGDVYLSTSSKNMKFFKHVGASPLWGKPMTWEKNKETLRLFRTSIYLEDVFTHTHYNCLANRYYEALFCGVSVIAHREACKTFDRAGVDLGEGFFSSYKEMMNIIEKHNDNEYLRKRLIMQQRFADAAKQEKIEVLHQISTIIASA